MMGVGRAILREPAFAGVLLVSSAWIVIEARFGWLGDRPIMEAIHRSGLWAVRLLAVSPLQLTLCWPKRISVRRILAFNRVWRSPLVSLLVRP
jgi:methionine sulfoxide reductase heme-binding subunit